MIKILIIILTRLVTVSNTSHATHYTKDVVTGSIDTDLSSGSTSNSSAGKNKLKGSIVNTGEVAASRGLVFLRAKSKGIYVDTGIGVTGVVLERLDNVEVGTLTLREAVLAVKLKLSGNNRVLSPTVHGKRSLSKYEGTSIGDTYKLSTVITYTEVR